MNLSMHLNVHTKTKRRRPLRVSATLVDIPLDKDAGLMASPSLTESRKMNDLRLSQSGKVYFVARRYQTELLADRHPQGCGREG